MSYEIEVERDPLTLEYQDSILIHKQDLEELEKIANSSVRPGVREIIQQHIIKLKGQVTDLEEKLKERYATWQNGDQRVVGGVQETSQQQERSRCYEVKVHNYGWDQENAFIKFYVKIPNVHSHDESKVKCQFETKSLNLVVSELDGKNYVFKINKLLNAINSSKSNFKIRKDTVVITAYKEVEEKWSHVTSTEKTASDAKKVSPLPEDNKTGDPSDSLMSIIKNMYDQGDDEMKRTIAKAWTEGQSKGPAF